MILIVIVILVMAGSYLCEKYDWPKDDGRDPFEGGIDQDTI